MSNTEGKKPDVQFDIPKDMTTVYMGLLKRGSAWTPEETPETEQLQAAHLAYIRQMAESGQLIMAGPFTDGGTLRGVFVFRVDSLEAAQALAAGPAALATLSQRDREIIALRFGGDLTGPEIAELLGLSLANVQQILSRSLRRLRAELDPAG